MSAVGSCTCHLLSQKAFASSAWGCAPWLPAAHRLRGREARSRRDRPQCPAMAHPSLLHQTQNRLLCPVVAIPCECRSRDLVPESQTQQSLTELREPSPTPTSWQNAARRGVVSGIIATACFAAFPATVHATAVAASSGVEEVARQISSSNSALGRQAKPTITFGYERQQGKGTFPL